MSYYVENRWRAAVISPAVTALAAWLLSFLRH